MIVTLDGQRLDTPADVNGTLHDVINRVRQAHDNCLIVSVVIDGERMNDETLQAALDQPVGTNQQVDLETGDATQLTRDALRGLGLEFASAGEGLRKTAERVTAGEAAAVQEIANFVQLWNTCHRVMVQCSGLLERDLTQVEHDGRPMQAWFQGAVESLESVRAALEARDLVLLSDLLQYELPGLCETWRDLMNALAEEVAGAGVQ